MSKNHPSNVSYAENLAKWSKAFSDAGRRNLQTSTMVITQALGKNSKETTRAAINLFDKIIEHAPPYKPGLEYVILASIPGVIKQYKQLSPESRKTTSLDDLAKSIVSNAQTLEPWSKKLNLQTTSTVIMDALEDSEKELAVPLYIKIIEHAPPYKPGLEDVILANIPKVIDQHKGTLDLKDDHSLDAIAMSITSKGSIEAQREPSLRFNESSGSLVEDMRFSGSDALSDSSQNNTPRSNTTPTIAKLNLAALGRFGSSDDFVTSPDSTPRSPRSGRGKSVIDPRDI